ncbi:MAG: hypothetical protein EXR73_12120 [Myxococcales bacterium]|nr:hypothetical protein [Myxococcales bacterium]
MDTKIELGLLMKNLESTARSYAHYGLEAGSKALGLTAETLTMLGNQLKQHAEQFAVRKDDDATPRA